MFPKGGSQTQEALYNCRAAKNLGWSVYCFGFEGIDINKHKAHSYYVYLINQIINFFINPDFVIYTFPHLLFKEDNTVKYAIVDIMTRDILNYREKILKNLDTFAWMNLYQGFIIYGGESQWFKALLSELKPYYHINKNYISGMYPGVYATEFYPGQKNKLFFCGNHWDKRRGSQHYGSIYKLLDVTDYFEVYGPKHSWIFLNKAYKGFIATDSEELIAKMRDLGITLLLHTDQHLKYGIPSLRIFEAAAASNAIISDYHPFIQQEFGNCIYYINPDNEPSQVVTQINNIVTFL